MDKIVTGDGGIAHEIVNNPPKTTESALKLEELHERLRIGPVLGHVEQVGVVQENCVALFDDGLVWIEKSTLLKRNRRKAFGVILRKRDGRYLCSAFRGRRSELSFVKCVTKEDAETFILSTNNCTEHGGTVFTLLRRFVHTNGKCQRQTIGFLKSKSEVHVLQATGRVPPSNFYRFVIFVEENDNDAEKIGLVVENTTIVKDTERKLKADEVDGFIARVNVSTMNLDHTNRHPAVNNLKSLGSFVQPYVSGDFFSMTEICETFISGRGSRPGLLAENPNFVGSTVRLAYDFAGLVWNTERWEPLTACGLEGGRLNRPVDGLKLAAMPFQHRSNNMKVIALVYHGENLKDLRSKQEKVERIKGLIETWSEDFDAFYLGGDFNLTSDHISDVFPQEWIAIREPSIDNLVSSSGTWSNVQSEPLTYLSHPRISGTTITERR